MVLNMVDIANYVLHHVPRRGRRSDGVAIYIHNSVSHRPRTDLNLISQPNDELDHSESLFIDTLLSNRKNIIVGVIYRAHGTNTDNFIKALNSCLTRASREVKHCYIS